MGSFDRLVRSDTRALLLSTTERAIKAVSAIDFSPVTTLVSDVRLGEALALLRAHYCSRINSM